MPIFSDIASNNCEQDVTISHDMGQYDTENLSIADIHKLKKRLEMELAYRLQTVTIDDSFDTDFSQYDDPADDDWGYDPFGDDDFEADNDNDYGFTVDIDHDFPGQVAAERNCFRFLAVMEELVDCEIRGVSFSYDREGNPVCTVKYWHGGEAEANVVFKINNGLDDAPVRSFASIK